MSWFTFYLLFQKLIIPVRHSAYLCREFDEYGLLNCERDQTNNVKVQYTNVTDAPV